jgi:predicted dehydrogenase
MESSRLGIIGAGYWGEKYIRVIHQMDSCELAFVVDSDAARVRQLSETMGVDGYSDLEEALNRHDCDSVIVSTPASSHRRIVERCLRLGLDVLVEKPLALSVADASEMVKSSIDAGRLLFPAHIYAHNDVVKRLVDLVKGGQLGDLRFVSASRVGLGPVRDDVNALWDLVPHDLTMLDLLGLEHPVEVTSLGSSFLRPGIEDIVISSLKYERGQVALLQASWLSPVKVRSFMVVGSEKTAIFDDTAIDGPLRIYSSGVDLIPTNEFGVFKTQIRVGDVESPFVEVHEPLKNLFAEFLRLRRSPVSATMHISRAIRIVGVLETLAKALLDENRWEVPRKQGAPFN